jgi:hypothetical protein
MGWQVMRDKWSELKQALTRPALHPSQRLGSGTASTPSKAAPHTVEVSTGESRQLQRAQLNEWENEGGAMTQKARPSDPHN